MERSWPISYTPPTSLIARPDEYLMVNLVGYVVPEPSPVALGLLSLSGWWLIRRWRR